MLQTGVEGAREWYTRGTVAYELGDYKRAYDCFVHAYDQQPYAAFVFNQAAALDLLGNVDAAVQAYERYLALDPRAKDAEKVRGRIKRLRDQPSGADVKQPLSGLRSSSFAWPGDQPSSRPTTSKPWRA